MSKEVGSVLNSDSDSMYSRRQIDWREDRFAIYLKEKSIVSGLTAIQADQLLSFLRAQEKAFLELRRFSVFEHEDGIYEHRLGSYVLVRDVSKLLGI